jgi:hypothetical protein
VGDVGSRLAEHDTLLQSALAPQPPEEGKPAKGNQLLALLEVGAAGCCWLAAGWCRALLAGAGRSGVGPARGCC